MIVCVCHRISDRDIARAAREGCASFDELQLRLQMDTVCGNCCECAREVLQQHLPALPADTSPASAST